MTTTMTRRFAPARHQLHCKGGNRKRPPLPDDNPIPKSPSASGSRVYGGIGKAARNWECFHASFTSSSPRQRGNAAGPVGKPVGVFLPRHGARVIIANSNLVGKWANWDHFHELDPQRPHDVRPDDRRQLSLHRHTGILQGTCQTFAALSERHFAKPGETGTLKGKLVVTGVSAAWRRAAAFCHVERRRVLAIDVDRTRIQRRVDDRYCDTVTEDLDEALALCDAAKREGRALSVD